MAASKQPLYFRVGPAIWREPWTQAGKHLALYLLTCEHRVTEGLYRLPRAYALGDLEWTARAYDKAFSEIASAGFVDEDRAAHAVLITKALKWQKPNGNQIIHAVRKIEVERLTETVLFPRFYALAQEFHRPFAEALAEAFPEAFPEALGKPPVSSSSSSSTTPRPPQAGELEADDLDEARERLKLLPPVRPSDRRARKQEAWREQFASWASVHFPDGEIGTLQSLVALLRSRNVEPTPAAIREFAERNDVYAAAVAA